MLREKLRLENASVGLPKGVESGWMEDGMVVGNWF